MDFGRISAGRLGNFVTKLEVFPTTLRLAAGIFDIVSNRDSIRARYNIAYRLAELIFCQSSPPALIAELDVGGETILHCQFFPGGAD